MAIPALRTWTSYYSAKRRTALLWRGGCEHPVPCPWLHAAKIHCWVGRTRITRAVLSPMRQPAAAQKIRHAVHTGYAPLSLPQTARSDVTTPARTTQPLAAANVNAVSSQRREPRLLDRQERVISTAAAARQAHRRSCQTDTRAVHSPGDVTAAAAASRCARAMCRACAAPEPLRTGLTSASSAAACREARSSMPASAASAAAPVPQ